MFFLSTVFIDLMTWLLFPRYFMLPPLMFWLLDKSLRLYRTRAVTAVSLEAGCGGIIRIVLPANVVC